MDSVVIVIPIYQKEFSESEWFSLKQTFKILGHHPISIVYPESLSIEKLKSNFSFNAVPISDKYFGSIKAYNNLVLSAEFYGLFEKYEYMLICQTDVLVFKDDLKLWVEKGYDYIGATWINKFWLIWHNVFLKDGILNGIKCLLNPRFYNSVGNGGFSLRNIQSFLQVFENLGVSRIPWNSNEDYFWGIFAKNFKIPSGKEALLFSIETESKKALESNKGELPFGVHAWEKFEPEVWEPYVNQIKSQDT